MRHASSAASPRATGGIARLAAARALEAGIALDPLLRQAGLNSAEIEDSNVRIRVEKQVAWLNLVAEALRDDQLDFTSPRVSICGRSVCSTLSWPRR